MHWIDALAPWVVALAAFVILVAAGEVGWFLSVRRPLADEHVRSQWGAVQAAVLALLGLLLAFSFSMASSRFEMRRDLVVHESNAIGAAYLRARMLPDPERVAVRELLRAYVDARVAFFDAGEDPESVAAAIHRSEAILFEVWAYVTDAAVAEGDYLSRSLSIQAVNDVIALHARRVAADYARVPARILMLLLVVAATGLGTVGWCFGLSRGSHRGPCVLLSALIATILFVVLDLDEPQHGRIRTSQESMQHLQRLIEGR